MKLRRISFAAVLTAALTLTAPTMAPSQAAQPSVPAPSPGAMPNAVPGTNTPAVDNGDVRAIARVGSAMIMGGNFTSVGGQVRNHVAAFNAATGALSTTFHPSVDGAVFAVISGPVANTAFIGGQFSSVGGVAVNDLALIDTTDGHLVSTFQAPSLLSGQVNDLVLRGNRLYLGGTFPKVGGVNHAGLASLNATSGALDPFVNIQLAGHHNDTGGGAQGAVGPWALDVTADGSKMVVIGNFKTANGLLRDQVVMIDLSGASAAVQTSWATSRYSPLCFNWAFDSYVRGVSFSPDGSYFVIAATGGPNAGTLCDAVARFETSATGTDVQPTWIDETGGDTVWAITVTDTAVFVGGHQRWANNPDGGDSAGPGAVPRPGLMALDPISGRPLQWNPGRNPPGKAVYALLATSDGLYVGSNTDWIGNRKYKRQKIAFFPYAGGIPAVSTAAGQLPGSVYLGGSQATNVLYRVNAGGPTLQSLDAGPNWISDSDADSPYRNSGSNAGVWDPVPSVDSSVPSSTAAAVFDTERWDPGDGEEMTWQFPVASGTPLDVRLYLANRCGCTGSVGARVFDVELNGQPWINDEDLVADVGDQVGTMKHLELNAPASGVITITFLHQTENTLVNGIEIVRTDITPPTTNVLYRVNAGGPAIQSLDGGANWRGDEAGDSPLRNSGSNTAGWSPVSSVDATVPSSTPAAIFDTERWDPGDGDEMSWQFPVTAGTPVEVRLYLANRCDCTNSPGARVFDVDLNGQPWINDEDLVADVGDQVGTMKSLDLNAPASGVITITFRHQTENPLVNGIEIVRTDISPDQGSGVNG
ncbi:MAG: malectin domain-containing carbohydrate-binding protein, partial [Nocardioidaceae bacterium]